MIGETQTIVLEVVADDGMIGSSEAVSLGLIVTELVINALKYAFPTPQPDARVLVAYDSDGPDWNLVVCDNGIGKTAPVAAPSPTGGLGAVIVSALVKQLDATLDETDAGPGMRVSIARKEAVSTLPHAA